MVVLRASRLALHLDPDRGRELVFERCAIARNRCIFAALALLEHALVAVTAGGDAHRHPPEEIDFIMDRLNLRPRKGLGKYQTSNY